MRLIDSCGWLEFFTDGPLADRYADEIETGPPSLLVPSIVLYEVYKFLLRTSGEEIALPCVAHMQQCRQIDLDPFLALEAAEASLQHGLAMADAVVFASARRHHAELVTSDGDLRGLPGVRFVEGS